LVKGKIPYTLSFTVALKIIATDHKISSLKGKPGKTAPSVVKGKHSHSLHPSNVEGRVCIAEHAKMHKKPKAVLSKQKVFGRHVVKTMTSVLQRKAVALAAKAEFEKKYLSIDKKGQIDSPFDDKLKLIEMEISELRAAAKDMFGNSDFEICLFDCPNFPVTGGVSLVTQPVRPDIQSGGTNAEFTACAALFDEFKVESLETENYPTAFATSAAVGQLATQTAFGVIAYDPIEVTALVNIIGGLELQHHIKMPISITNPAAAGALVTNVIAKPHKFHCKPPPGVLLNVAAPSTIGTTTWQPTVPVTGFLAYGWVKCAYQGLAVANTFPAFVSHWKYNVKFRIRT